MIIKPKGKGFICLTAHPEGCRENVKRQIEYVKAQPVTGTGKKTLVIGCSTGYGLSSRICAAFSDSAPTIGICFEKPSMKGRTATPGWYNTAAFEEFAAADGLYAKTINGDAYSAEVKGQAADLIERDFGQLDLLVYSLAAPRRTMPDGTVYSSVLKTVGAPMTGKSLDLEKNTIVEKTLEPATDEEVNATVRVMGGDDWKDWIDYLRGRGLLSENFRTVAYSYIGPVMTYPIYNDGTIGRAKRHVYDTAVAMREDGVDALVSVNKAVVTQSSAAIPSVPLYIAILYKVMKAAGTHEDTIQQMYRLWSTCLTAAEPACDIPGRVRVDDWEMADDIQAKVAADWDAVTTETLSQYADIKEFWDEFYRMFGFGFDGVDYEADVDPEVAIPSIANN